MIRKARRKILGIISLGCPKNTVDSERLLGELEILGWEFTDDINNAECLIVNTCGFIQDAILESIEALEEICEIRKDNPDVILIATGCLPQRDGFDLARQFPDLDLVCGVGSLPDLPGLIELLWNKEKPEITRVEDLIIPGRATLSPAAAPRLRLTQPWTAYIKISEGCGHSCSFCTIPAIKGPHVSRPIGDIVEEAKYLASEGIRELIIISQDTTAYGSDIGSSLNHLLTELNRANLPNETWIRLHYLYPSKISPALLNTIADSSNIIPYFDIPLQHVQPKILRLMNRLAPDIDAIEIIEKIRMRFADSPVPACIRTTFIVGFPGETEEDIDALHEFLESARIDRLTIFRFSPENGTPAAELPDQVQSHIAEQRIHQIMEAQQDISLEIHEKWINKEIDVLMEGETDDGRRVGRSYRDAPEIDGLVLVGGVPESVEPGSIIRTRITGALPYDLEAEWMK